MSSFGSSNFGGSHGIKAADRPSRSTGRATTADLTASRPKPKLKKVLPEVWKLIKPRRWLIAGSFLLMIINRFCSFALPVSSRFLINNVMSGQPIARLSSSDRLHLLNNFLYQRQHNLLPWIIGAVAAATFLQGVTSYALTQLLSTEGQRLISDLPYAGPAAHRDRLPVAFYDANRTGTSW